MKKIIEDDTKTKANTISAHTDLPPLQISECEDFGFLYYSWLQSSWLSNISESWEFEGENTTGIGQI